MTRRILVSVLLSFALALAVTATLVKAFWISLPVRGFFGYLVIVLVVLSIGFFRHDRIERSHDHELGRPKPESPGREELQRAASDVSKRYSEEAIRYFFWAMTGLRSYLTRVDETASLEYNSLRIRTELTLAVDETYRKLPPDDDARQSSGNLRELNGILLVPLIMTTKGKLIDDLEMKDASGNILASLSQYETRGLLAIVMQNLFRISKFEYLVKKGRLSATDPAPELDEHEQDVVWKIVIEYACRVGRLRDDNGRILSEPQLKQKLSDYFENLRLGDRFEAAWIGRIKSICLGLANNYVIVTEAPMDAARNQLSAVYSQLLPIATALENHDHIRARLGLSPNKVDAPLSRALEAESYHFQLQAEPARYVFNQHLEHMGTNTVVRQSDLKLAGVQQYARVHYDEARNNAHLYIRRQGFMPDGVFPSLKTVIELREVPPGVLGAAALLAVVNTIVIFFFTVTRAGLYRSSGGLAAVTADVPALLLAVPAFVAVFVGNWSDTATIARCSLRAYGGLALTMLISFSSALYYIFSAYNKTPTEITVSLSWNNAHWTTDILWLCLAFSSLCLAGSLIQELRVQTRYYLDRLLTRVIEATK